MRTSKLIYISYHGETFVKLVDSKNAILRVFPAATLGHGLLQGRKKMPNGERVGGDATVWHLK